MENPYSEGWISLNPEARKYIVLATQTTYRSQRNLLRFDPKHFCAKTETVIMPTMCEKGHPIFRAISTKY